MRDYSVGDLVDLAEAELKAREFLPREALRATQVAETFYIFKCAGHIVIGDRIRNEDTEFEAVR